MVAAWLAAGGCAGDPVMDDPGAGGSPADPTDPPTPGVAACAGVPEARLLRVDRTLYVNALSDIFGAPVVADIAETINALPALRAGVYGSELAAPTFAEVESYSDIAIDLAFELTGDRERLAALAPCLAGLGEVVMPQSDACLQGFILGLGRRLMRRELTSEETARFAEAFDLGGKISRAEGVATVLATMLVDPQFLYFVENGGAAGPEASTLALSAHEVAARLARVLWDGFPDAELEAAAARGWPPGELDQQIVRMAADPRARLALRRFFSDWLDLDHLPLAAPVWAATAPARHSLRAAMADEVLDLAERVVFDHGGGYAELLLDPTTTLSEPGLARIYGVEPAVSGERGLPDTQRAGLLTRAGWLATAEVPRTDAGHVIARGARLGRFVCHELPRPDPSLFPAQDPGDPRANPSLNIRDRFRAVTTSAQCESCHAALDGLGAPFGHYGAAGQWLERERINAALEPVDLPIDARASVRLDGSEHPIDDALALSRVVAESHAGPQCLAQQFVRRALGRPLAGGDQCLVQAALAVLRPEDGAAPGRLADAFVAFLRTPAFLNRVVGP